VCALITATLVVSLRKVRVSFDTRVSSQSHPVCAQVLPYALTADERIAVIVSELLLFVAGAVCGCVFDSRVCACWCVHSAAHRRRVSVRGQQHHQSR
jgi:hypothetical protein